MIRVTALTVLAMLTVAAPTAADKVRVLGHIGCHKQEFQPHAVTTVQRFPISGRPDYIAITEVYPDLPDPVTYDYTVTIGDSRPYHRSFRSVGFGKLTWFMKAGSGGDVRIVRENSSRPSRPVLIDSVAGVTQSELDKLLKRDAFTIMGLLPSKSEKERDELAFMLVDQIDPEPKYGIGIGFASEIGYANQDAATVESKLVECAELAKRYKVPALIGLISWWSGTPLGVADGAGGKFGDMKYQQICYSPDKEHPVNSDLQKLLGSRYDQHYRLSTPNQWSNVPWLTMNDRTLNDYRSKRLTEAVGLLKKVSSGDASWLAGVYLENEPRYWDSQCEAAIGDANPPRLWADFNPVTVADAKRDGVELNPADGLSNDELAWLHRNVGRYMQDVVSVYRAGALSSGFSLALPVYTHSLQLRNMFPGAAINHPASEWAYAVGARSGIEGMNTMPSDFYRLREWGKWGDVDREENDGMDIALHLWDLRVAYMMGSDLYNSYNWHAIGPERFIAYVKEFLAEFPVVTLPPAEVTAFDRYGFKMKTPMKLQAFSRLDVPVKVESSFKGVASVGIVLADGTTVTSENMALDLSSGSHTVGFEFTTPAESVWRGEALVTLYAFDSGGRMALDRISLDPQAAGSIKLALDLRTQRALSLAAIKRAEAANGGTSP